MNNDGSTWKIHNATTKHLEKIHLTSHKEKASLKKAKPELHEGAVALVEYQKHIQIVDQSEHSWKTVAV